MNKKYFACVVIYFLVFSICFGENEHNQSLYELKLYYNPLSAYSEKSLEQVRNGAYENSISHVLTKKQVNNILQTINKKMKKIEDFMLPNGISYVDFSINKNMHSFGEIIDSKQKIIIYFSFDEVESQYMIINDCLYLKNQYIYDLIRDDIIFFQEEHDKKINEIKKNAREFYP